MKTRREFFQAGARIGAHALALSASSILLPRRTHAHSSAKVTRVGFLGAGPRPTAERPNIFLNAFRERLAALGLPESETFAVESRFAEGNLERIPSLVADLVKLDVKAIVTPGTPTATIVKRETSLPLVMIGDPLGANLAASMDKPGGTVTGFASNPEHIVAHRVKLLKTVAPGLTRAGLRREPREQGHPWHPAYDACRSRSVEH